MSKLLRAHRPIGWSCAQPRALNLPPDPEAQAASGFPHARVLDLSALMCNAQRCPAVIGGVLVRKDGTHLTRTFATTLGPFVLRAL